MWEVYPWAVMACQCPIRGYVMLQFNLCLPVYNEDGMEYSVANECCQQQQRNGHLTASCLSFRYLDIDGLFNVMIYIEKEIIINKF